MFDIVRVNVLHPHICSQCNFNPHAEECKMSCYFQMQQKMPPFERSHRLLWPKFNIDYKDVMGHTIFSLSYPYLIYCL
uniref:Uncharacterized protein n=1 Tax=Rhizophora mucronata TaxID=61149 RepID=A0A2P2QS74_RHIMU